MIVQDTLPTNFASWKSLIWTQCNIQALELRYATKLKNFKQGPHMAYSNFYLQYTTLMRKAGVYDTAMQAHHFKDALNEQDHFLLTSSESFRTEALLGTTIQRINDRMVLLLLYREENASIFKNLQSPPRPSGSKTGTSQVVTPHTACGSIEAQRVGWRAALVLPTVSLHQLTQLVSVIAIHRQYLPFLTPPLPFLHLPYRHY